MQAPDEKCRYPMENEYQNEKGEWGAPKKCRCTMRNEHSKEKWVSGTQKM